MSSGAIRTSLRPARFRLSRLGARGASSVASSTSGLTRSRAVRGLEQLNNPGFNSLEFEGIGYEAGRDGFFLSVKKWAEKTGATGVCASAGRYGGTYAHRDIAFEFGSWLSPECKLYLIKEFQRLKDDEAARASREWSFQRTLSKVNYRIHTDAIQEHLIPPTLTKVRISFADS